MSAKLLLPAGALLLGFGLVLSALMWLARDSSPTPPADLPLLWPAKAVGTFALTDHTDAVLDEQRIEGVWTLWYFGYTGCPDVCPVSLTVLDAVQSQLGADTDFREPVQTVFVSVDPERDDPARLGRYVAFFNPTFVAATGSEAQLKALTEQLGVQFQLDSPDDMGNYFVDHTAAILLTDPRARLVAWFSAPHTADEMSEQIRRIADFVNAAKS